MTSELPVLVTGACGFSGSHLVKHLLARGEHVVASDLEHAFRDDRRRAVLERIGLDLKHPSLDVRPADLTDRRSLERLFTSRYDVIFHTASLYDYSAPLERLRLLNVAHFESLLDLVVADPPERFVHWSTCGVFGRPCRLSHPRSNAPFTEDSPSPRNTPFGASGPAGTTLANDYSVSKWEQEQLAWKVHRERGLPLTVIRPAPIYGPGSEYGHMGIVLAVHRGLLPAIPADARNHVTVSVHVEDLARFALHAARRPEALGEDYNVVDDSVISHAEFVRYIALLCGRRVIEVPLVRLESLKPLVVQAARTWAWLARHHRLPRVRMLEPGSAVYLGSSYWIQNEKSKSLGFEYRYPDVRVGLRDSIRWMRDAGWM
jgi:nucleoside-diphosphate-sugar epimerase